MVNCQRFGILTAQYGRRRAMLLAKLSKIFGKKQVNFVFYNILSVADVYLFFFNRPTALQPAYNAGIQ